MTPGRVSPFAVYALLRELLAKRENPTTPFRLLFTAAWLSATVAAGGVFLIDGSLYAIPAVSLIATVALALHLYFSTRNAIRRHVAASLWRAAATEKHYRDQVVQGQAYLAMIENVLRPDYVADVREAVERFEISGELRNIERRNDAVAFANFARGQVARRSS